MGHLAKTQDEEEKEKELWRLRLAEEERLIAEGRYWQNWDKDEYVAHAAADLAIDRQSYRAVSKDMGGETFEHHHSARVGEVKRYVIEEDEEDEEDDDDEGQVQKQITAFPPAYQRMPAVAAAAPGASSPSAPAGFRAPPMQPQAQMQSQYHPQPQHASATAPGHIGGRNDEDEDDDDDEEED